MAADNISKFYNAFSAEYDNFASEQEFRDWLGKADASKMNNLYKAFNSVYDNFSNAEDMNAYLGWGKAKVEEKPVETISRSGRGMSVLDGSPFTPQGFSTKFQPNATPSRGDIVPAATTAPKQEVAPEAAPQFEMPNPDIMWGGDTLKDFEQFQPDLSGLSEDEKFIREYESRKRNFSMETPGALGWLNENQPAYVAAKAGLENPLRGKSNAEIRQEIADSKEEEAFVEEYERIQKEFKQEKDAAFRSAGKHASEQMVDPSKREYLEKNKAQFEQAKKHQDNLKDALAHTPEWEAERAEMDEQTKEAKASRAAILLSTVSGMPSHDPESKLLETNQIEEAANWNAVVRINKMTERSMDAGSKLDAKVGGVTENIKQYVEGFTNNVDVAKILTFGLADAGPLMDARRLGDKSNKIVTEAIKSTGYEGDVNELEKSIRAMGAELAPMDAELKTLGKGLEDMAETYKDMERNGASAAELRDYYKQYEKKYAEYKEKYDQYAPLAEKYNEALGTFKNISDAIGNALEVGLSDSEKAVLEAYDRYCYVTGVRAATTSNAAKAGAAAEESAEFMLDFILTGGLGKAGTKAATKLTAKWAAKRAGQRGLTNIAADLPEAMNKLVAKGIKPSISATMLTDMGVAAKRTLIMFPRSLNAYGEALIELNPEQQKDEFGRYNFSRSYLNAALNTAVNQYIEYWSEGFGTYFAAGEQALFKAVTGAAPVTTIGRTLTQYRGSIGKYLDYGKFDGLFNEGLEEVVGSIFNSLAGAFSGNRIGDANATADFFAADNLTTLFFSFLPMSAISAGTNIYAYNKMKSRYNASVENLSKFIEGGSLAQADLDALTADITGSTPEHIKERIVAITDKVRKANGGKLPSDFTQSLLGLVEGSLCMQMEGERWADSAEKAQVAASYATTYANPVYNPWDADKAEQDARKVAEEAGFTEEELNQDPYRMAQNALAMQATAPERAEVLNAYANAKATRQGLEDGYREETMAQTSEEDEYIRGSLDNNGQVITAYLNGEEVFVTAKDATITPDGRITVNGKDGVVTIQRGDKSQGTVKASQLENASAMDTEMYSLLEVNRIANERQAVYDQAASTISVNGMRQAVTDMVGQTVYLSDGQGVYEPIQIVRSTGDGKVVVKGSKNALDAIIVAAQVDIPRGSMIEVDGARIYPMLAQNENGTLATNAPEQGAQAPALPVPEAEAPVEEAPAAQEAPVEASPVEGPSMSDLQGSERTIYINGNAYNVEVTRANERTGQVEVMYKDEEGNDIPAPDGMPNVFDYSFFVQALSEPVASAPAETEAPTPEAPVAEVPAAPASTTFDGKSTNQWVRENTPLLFDEEMSDADRAAFVGALEAELEALRAKKAELEDKRENDKPQVTTDLQGNIEARKALRAKYTAQIEALDAEIAERERRLEGIRGVLGEINSHYAPFVPVAAKEQFSAEELTPQTPEEAVAEYIAKNFKSGGQTIDIDDFRRETGYKGEASDFFFLKKGGMTIRELAEHIAAEYPGLFGGAANEAEAYASGNEADDNRARNAIIELFGQVRNKTDINNYILGHRREQAQAEAERQNADLRHAMEEAVGMPLEQYESQRQRMIQEDINAVLGSLPEGSDVAAAMRNYYTEKFGETQPEAPAEEAALEGNDPVAVATNGRFHIGEEVLFLDSDSFDGVSRGIIIGLDEDREGYVVLGDGAGNEITERITRIRPAPEDLPFSKSETVSIEENPNTEAKKARIAEWADRLGLPITVLESLDEVKDPQARKEIVFADMQRARGGNAIVEGWYNPRTHKVEIYLPHLAEDRVDKVVIHEVVSHRGLRELLKTVDKEGNVSYEKFNALMDFVWNDLMSEKDKAKWLAYNSGMQGSPLEWRRAAADEYVAKEFSERLDPNKHPSKWRRFVTRVKQLLKSIGIDIKVSGKDMDNLLLYSLRNYERNRDVETEEAQVEGEETGGNQYSRVYHGTGADFDRFDHSHMGEGSGSQSYGWGTYVTTNHDTGTTYANSTSGKRVSYAGEKAPTSYADELVNGIAQDMQDHDKSFEDAKRENLDMLKRVEEKRKAGELGEYWKNVSNEKEIEFLEGLKESDFNVRGDGGRHLYIVDIPDDNGENYLHWDGYLTRGQSNKIMDAVREILKQRGEYQDETEYELKSALGFGTIGRQVEPGLDYFLGDQKNYATGENPGAERNAKLLNSLGIVGMEIPIDRNGGQRYPGSNYVIFDENNLKIADHLRFSRTPEQKAEDEKVFAAAKDYFGTTRDIREAGYILPDGTMLDFSGRHALGEGADSSFLEGRRAIDHKEIADLNFEKDGNTPSGLNVSMPDFIRSGAIRIDSNAGAINLATLPTDAQQAVLRRLIEANGGDVWVDFGDGYNSEHYVEYEGARPTKVLNEIVRYFNEGYKPENSLRFSKVAQMDADYLAAVGAGDMEQAARMVKEAAAEAMPNTKVANRAGIPVVVYHGTTLRKFDRYDYDFINEQPFYVFSTDQQMGAHFGTERQAKNRAAAKAESDRGFTHEEHIYPVYLNIENPCDVDDVRIFSVEYLLPNLVKSGTITAEEARYISTDKDLKEALISKGYDGLFYWNDVEGDGLSFVAFYPQQIKSAEPVVYDDNGQVVPLSERFNPGNNDIRFSKANANEEIFISNAEKAVEDIKQEKATPQQWLAQLEKNGGLKAGEDKWLGLSDWLKASDRKTLTKQEVLDYIKENKITIEETHYRDYSKRVNPKLEAFNEEFRELIEEGDEATGSVYTRDHVDWAFNQMVEKYGDDFRSAFTPIENRDWELEPAIDWNDELSDVAKYFLGEEDAINATRLDYTTEGLDNKREIALTVPTIQSWNEGDKVHFGDAGEGRAIAWIRFGDARIEEDIRSANAELAKLNEEVKELSYKAAIGEYNDRIAYLEAAARRDKLNRELKHKQSKVLFIDEIQSKRHQEGREHGYKDPKLTKLMQRIERINQIEKGILHDNKGEKIPFTDELKAERSKLLDQFMEMSGLENPPMPSQLEMQEDTNQYFINYNGQRYAVGKGAVSREDAFEYLYKYINDRVAEKNKEVREELSKRVPAAPFEKNWYELAMKRMLRLAAEEGYDYVAWTTGEQQAERYNIGQVVDSIGYDSPVQREREIAPSVQFVIRKVDGNKIPGRVFTEGEYKGIVVETWENSWGGKPLSDVVGKSIANQIIEAKERGDIEGEGLRIGGEGMKGFYDDILPRFMNKYGKKWGVKVEDIELPGLEESARTMHAVPITPEMRESVMEGQLMFSKVGEESKNNTKFAYNDRVRRTEESYSESPAGELGEIPGRADRRGSESVGEPAASAEYAASSRRLGLLAKGLDAERAEYLAESAGRENGEPVSIGADARSNRNSRGVDAEARAAEALVRLAKENGFYYEPQELSGKFGEPYKKQGSESITLISPDGRVFTKFKDPFKADFKFKGPHTPFDVVAEVMAHNALFPETPYRFMGVTSMGHKVRLILQQDAVPSNAHVSHRQLKAYMKGRGFDYNLRDAHAENKDVQIGDVDERNILVDADGKVRVIDPIIRFRVDSNKALKNIEGYKDTLSNLDISAKSESHPEAAEFVNAFEEYMAKRDDANAEEMDTKIFSTLLDINDSLNREGDSEDENLRYEIEDILDDFHKPQDITRAPRVFADRMRDTYDTVSTSLYLDEPTQGVLFSKATPSGMAGNIVLSHAIDSIADSFKGAVKVNKVSRDQMPKGHKTDKGYYDTRTGEVYICIDNIESVDDAIATVMHEAVAHLGLRQLFGDRFPEAMTAIYEAMSPEIRHEVHASMTRNGWDAITATEEYLARLAEKEEFTPKEKTFWDRVKEIFEAILAAITGKANVSLTDNELRYILQASYMNLTATPAERQGVQYAAREILLKDKYKVNDYVEPEYLARTPVFANGTDSIKNYEESVERKWQVAQMEFQDAQQPVRIGIAAIQAETGNKPIAEDEDYLTKENLVSSIAQTQQVEYLMSQIAPIVEQVAHIIEKISGKKNPSREERAKIYNDIISYLYAKHGAERNRYANPQLAKQLQEEIEKARKEYEDAAAALEEEVEAHNVALRTGKTDRKYTAEQVASILKVNKDYLKNQKAKLKREFNSKKEKLEKQYEGKDWSGLTSLFGLEKTEHEAAEALADELCEKFEAEVGKDDIDLLWDRIQAATDYNLKHALDSGLLSKDEYDRLHGNKEKGIARMWEHYVPLRGFTEKTAEEEYNYANLTRQQANSVVTKKYKGRTSLASDPIANIVNIGETEIRQGNANLAKIALYRYVMNRPEGKLLTATDMWFVKQDDGTWVLAEPQAKYDASDKQVGTESFEDFENRMEALKAKGLARKGRRNLQLDKIMTNPGHQNEHLIRLKVNGQEKGIWVNGNPQLARAVAGSLRKESMEGLRNLTRSLSNLFTTYSLKFALRNFWRDTLYSQMRLLAMSEENGREYLKKYEANWLKNFGAFTNAPMIRMVSQWNKGTLQKKDNPTETEKMFMDFMRDGGPTGYTVTRSVEQVIKDIHKDLNMFRPDGSWLKVMWENASSSQFAKALGIYPRAVQALNESFELLTRFTAYQTSRQMGRSGQQAASDAKEISVNFNRKGAQSGKGFFGAVAAYFGATHYFFNAGVQGFQNFMSLYQKHPYKMTAFSTMLAMMGFLTPYINALLAAFGGGDDDDDQTLWYWNLPEWTRRSSIVIGTAKGYVAIALGPEQRALYGLGDIIAAYVDGRYANKSAMNIAADVVSQLAGLLPVNPVEDLQGSQNVLDAALRTFMPDPLMAAYDMAVNRDYTGRPLQKENPFSKTSPNCYGAYSSTPDGIVKACQWIAEETAKAGYMIDLPPGYIREVFRQYGGGIYTAFEEAAKFTAGILNEDKPLRTSDFPLTSGVIGSLDDDRKDSFAKNALNEYKSMEQVLTKTMKVLLHDPDITEKGLFEGGLPDDAPKYASKLFESEDYELAKMYYEGENGKYLHAANGKRIRKQQDGLKDYRKKWNDLKDEYAKMPKGTEEEKKAREKKKEEIEKAWDELVTAENKLVDELLQFEYKHPSVSKKIEDAIKK